MKSLEERIQILEKRLDNLEKHDAPEEVQKAARQGFKHLTINPEQETSNDSESNYSSS